LYQKLSKSVNLHLSQTLEVLSFGVAMAPFESQHWGLPHRLAQCVIFGSCYKYTTRVIYITAASEQHKLSKSEVVDKVIPVANFW